MSGAAGRRTSCHESKCLSPTYNEDERVIEKSVAGALAIDYGNFGVWVLDDGKRDWLAQRSADWGVGYLRRQDAANAKAGNLNAGMRRIGEARGEPAYWAILDADFVAVPAFLERTVSLAEMEGAAIVQTPQFFYNLDPIQYALGAGRALPDTQRFLFEAIMPSREAHGESSCCGTSFLVRAKDLAELGGFPTDSITEDTLMSMRLQARGRKTLYLNEPLSMGLAAESIEEHLNQQARWCLGWMQIAHTELGPFGPLKKGCLQRIRELYAFLAWGLPALVRVTALFVPVVYWTFGVAPFEAQTTDLLTHFLPLWISVACIRAALSGGTDLPVLGDALQLLSAYAVVPATWRGLTATPHSFRVTAKGLARDRVTLHTPVLRWIALAGLLNAIGAASHLLRGGPRDGFFAWALCWSAFVLIVLLVAAMPCIELPQRRAEVRFRVEDTARLRMAEGEAACRLCNLSLTGAMAHTDATLAVGQSVHLICRSVGELPATVVRSGRGAVAFRFHLDWAARRRLIGELFRFDTLRPVRTADIPALVGCILWRLRHPLGFRRRTVVPGVRPASARTS